MNPENDALGSSKESEKSKLKKKKNFNGLKFLVQIYVNDVHFQLLNNIVEPIKSRVVYENQNIARFLENLDFSWKFFLVVHLELPRSLFWVQSDPERVAVRLYAPIEVKSVQLSGIIKLWYQSFLKTY